MAVFVAGATGATGRLLVEQLLNRNVNVKTVVRDKNRLPEKIRSSRKPFNHGGGIIKLKR
ncbi:MAG: NAD(P)H-binding protein [Melioribacteraceae bacterium]|nr:NAD(P)H-binding protein [Melioribacteraceae bacterium]